MRKQVFGRKFKRDANERKALLKGLMTDLVMKESIQTTEEKAKAIKGQVEKLVTKAIKSAKGGSAYGGKSPESLLQPYLSVAAYRKVINDLSKRFADRPGGYTRIVKLGQRFGDNAKMAIIEWVDKTKVVNETNETNETKGEKRVTSRSKVVKPVAKKPAAKPVKKAVKKASK